MLRKSGLLALLLFALAGAMSCAASAQIQAPDSGSRISLVTFNLYHDKDDWPKRREQLLRQMQALRPDAIALNEVLQHEQLRNQAQWLAERLGYQVAFFSTDAEGQPRRYGNALLTRHPILARAERRLQPHDDSRTAGLLRIDMDRRLLNLYVTHLHWTDGGGAIRERQVRDLLQFVADSADGAPALLLGDFNAEARAPELAAIAAGYADAFALAHPQATAEQAGTLNRHYYATPRSIDHVFLPPRQFGVASAQRLFDRPDANGVWASDHYGLHVVLQMANPHASTDAP